LKEGRFRLDIRGKLFAVRVVRCWNRMPTEAVDAPSIPGGVHGRVGWGPGQPVPAPHHPLGKSLLPDIQPKSSLLQLKTISPCPAIIYPCKKLTPLLFIGFL